MLERDHAAEARAVRQAAPVAGAGALDHDHLARRLQAQRRLLLPAVEQLRELGLRDDALVPVAEVIDEAGGRGLTAHGCEDGARLHVHALWRLREVDGALPGTPRCRRRKTSTSPGRRCAPRARRRTRL